jgi:endonuclease YncB( thermonuclease family)
MMLGALFAPAAKFVSFRSEERMQAAMSNLKRRNYRRRTWRRPADRRAQFVVFGIIALLAAYAYSKKPSRTLPPVIAGSATVIDGDTISIGGTRIRLQGTDAPEWEQTCDDAKGASWPCGTKAARELGALIRDVTLTCKTSDFDQYDRVLAECSTPDSTNVNVWLVRQGWAVAFGRSRLYTTAEAEAKAAKRGLWQGGFTRPSDWRERERRPE